MKHRIKNNKNYPIQLTDGVVIAANGVLEDAPGYVLRLPAVRALINAGELSNDDATERSEIITNPVEDDEKSKVSRKSKKAMKDGDG